MPRRRSDGCTVNPSLRRRDFDASRCQVQFCHSPIGSVLVLWSELVYCRHITAGGLLPVCLQISRLTANDVSDRDRCQHFDAGHESQMKVPD